MNWGAVGNNETLTVYQKALQFVMTLYGICAVLPPSEEDHLVLLIKKAATGVTSHISEAGRKPTDGEKIRSLKTARGYLEECGYYLDHVSRQGYLNTATEKAEMNQVFYLLDEYLGILSEE